MTLAKKKQAKNSTWKRFPVIKRSPFVDVVVSPFVFFLVCCFSDFAIIVGRLVDEIETEIIKWRR